MESKMLLELIQEGEYAELECKLASRAVPKDVWHSYSAMANTDGGVILLGIGENLTTGRLEPKGVDAAKFAKGFLG